MRAPDVMSCPVEASASELSPGGLPVPEGLSCPVCLAPEGCPVSVFSPGGLLIPPNFPREFFLGGRKGSGCRGRAEGTEATATSTTCHGLQSSLHRHGLLSSQLRHALLCLFRSEHPPPPSLPGGIVTAWDTPSGRGGVMSGFCCVCVMCSCLLCPYLVCFLSLLSVIIS